jgi:membrane protease YdiL (CAAX protease family)
MITSVTGIVLYSLFILLIQFRGMIQTRLESVIGSVRSWGISGVIFGFYHYYVHYLVPGKRMAVEDILSLSFLTAFGMMLGVIFAKTRSLFPPFLVHTIHNFSLG